MRLSRIVANSILLGGLLVLATVASAQAQPVQTWSRIVGNFCLQGIPIAARKVEQSEINNGATVEQFRVDFASPNPPATTLFRVFRVPPQPASPLTRCSDIDAEVILEGRIKKLTIRGARETGAGAGPAYFEIGGISGSMLDVELTKVKSTLAPLYGGLLQLGADGSIVPSSRAWVRNSGRIATSSGTPGTGSLDIESWGRRLRGARVTLPGSNETVAADLSAGNTNITLRVAIDGSSTELRRGTLTSGRIELDGAKVSMPGSDLADVDGVADSLTVAAGDSGVELRLAGLRYRAKQGSLGSDQTRARGEKLNGIIGMITSPGARSGNAIAFSDQLVTNHLAGIERCLVDHKQVQLTAADVCRASISRADASAVAAEFTAVQAKSLMAGDALLPRGEVRWRLDRQAGADRLEGLVASADSRLGSLALVGPAVRFDNPVEVGPELTIPFSLTVGPSQGSWQFNSSAGQALIGGQLEELAVRGKIGVPIADFSGWHVDIAENDFRFSGGVSGEVRPHVYDGTPIVSVDTRLAFRSAGPLRIAATEHSGKIETSLSAFALSNLDIKLGKTAANLVLTGPIQFDGATVLSYDLARSRADIISGKLNVANVHLRSEPGKPGDLGTVRMRDADFRIGSISAAFEGDSGSFLIKDVRLDAGLVEQTPDGADQLRWSGSLASPLTIQTIGARIARDKDDALVLEDEIATDVNLNLADPTLGQGSQLRFRGERLALHFAELSKKNVRGSLRLSDARVAQRSEDTDFDIKDLDLDLEITGGPLSSPNGGGRLLAGAVSVDIDINPKIQFLGDVTRCDGDQEYRSLPLNVRFATSAVDMKLSMNDGQFRADGTADISGALIKERGQYECRKRVVRFLVVKEVRAKYKYPCPTWRKPFRMCRGWTTIVPEVRADVDRLFRIRHVRAAGVWKSATFRIFPKDGSTKFERCLQLGVFKPVIDASYFFTPKTSIPIADSIFQELIDLHSRPFVSHFMSGFVEIVARDLSLTKNGWCV